MWGFEYWSEREQRWSSEACGEQGPSNCFDTREAAEAELPNLASVMGCDHGQLRVVEIRVQPPKLAGVWAERSAVEVLTALCPAGVAAKGVSIEQDWDGESTTITFSDSSRLRVSGSTVEVLA